MGIYDDENAVISGMHKLYKNIFINIKHWYWGMHGLMWTPQQMNEW